MMQLKKNVANIVRPMAIDGKARRERPKNTWEKTIKIDLEKLSITVALFGDRQGYQDPTPFNAGKGPEDDDQLIVY